MNQPQDRAAWRQYAASRDSDPIAARRLDAYLRQARPMSAALRALGVDELATLLDTSDTADGAEVIRRELAVLWLNVMSGRLNRATEVDFPALPEVHTVGDLIAELERALAESRSPDALLGASRRLQAGQGILRSVCARLLYLQTGNKLQDVIWAADSLDKHPVLWQPDSADFRWDMGRLVPSPDYRWVAIETGDYERAGPVYLLNLEARELAKLNPTSALGNGMTLPYDGLGTWEVIGWHPDSQHLLIGPSDTGVVYWVDLQSNAFQTIPLTGMGGRDMIDLAPDGNGFIHAAGHGQLNNDDKQQVNFYDLRDGYMTTLFTLPDSEGNVYFPRFSPTGDSIAYVVEKRFPSTDYATKRFDLKLFDLNAKAHTLLFEGKLGWWEPVWSLDGEMMAFYNQEPVEDYISIPSVGRLWRGNIWMVSTLSGEAQQVTFVPGSAYQPVWSLDGRFLAFLTHDAQIGLTALEQPGVIWKIGAGSPDWPLFISMFFLP